jgi:hypothetical protein
MLAVPFLLALAPQSGLHVVDDDGGPGVAFTDLQAAVDAAADGDLILVRSGTYAPILVDGRSLSIVADAGADVLVLDPLASGASGVAANVKNVPDGGLVVLSGLGFDGRNGPGLGATIDAPGFLSPGDWEKYGTVWIERCTILGTANTSPFFVEQTPGALSMSLRGVVVHTTTGVPDERKGTRGFESNLAPVFAYASRFRGPLEPTDQSSGAGGRMVSASILAVDSVFEPGAAGSGAPGLELFAQADLLQPPFSPIPSFAVLLGSVADPVVTGAQSLTIPSVVTLPPRTLDEPNVVRSGVPSSLEVGGTPGELAFLLVSTDFADEYFIELKGLLAPLAPTILPLGAIPASGSLTVPVDLTLPGGTTFVRLFTQAALVSAADGIVLSDPGAVFVLGPGF